MQPNESNVNELKSNGIEETPKTKIQQPQPQPAPRRIIQPSTNGDLNKKQTFENNNEQQQEHHQQQQQNQQQQNQQQQNHKKATPTTSLEGDDVQVLPKPITNEEFQAMIPAHFLNKSQNNQNHSNNNNPNPDSTHAVTVTIKKPDTIELPPAPTGPGRVTETITKSTFTETVVTRITDNKLVMPLIIEVRQHELPINKQTKKMFNMHV